MIAVSVVAGCQTVPSPEATIIKPGVVAVDAIERQKKLIDADALDMCPDIYPQSLPRILHSNKAPRGYGLDDRYNEISSWFRLLGAGCLKGSQSACTAILDYSMKWVKNSKLGKPRRGSDGVVEWNDTLTINMRLLAPMIAALGVAEQFSSLSPSDRSQLNSWLKSKIDSHAHGMRSEGIYKGTGVPRAAHNHAVQSSIAAMSYGAWANNKKYFKTGLDQWFITLGSMRKDGSLPIESRRGARALFYTGRTISALMQLAERAAAQGIDLYGAAPSENKTIHHAVGFLIDALEKPDLVLKYARANHWPGPSKNYKIQDLGNHVTTFGFIAPYMARFPNHPNTRRLMMRQQQHSRPQNYLTGRLDGSVKANGGSSEWIGVDARCFYAEPSG